MQVMGDPWVMDAPSNFIDIPLQISILSGQMFKFNDDFSMIKQADESIALHYQDCMKLKSQLQQIQNEGQSCQVGKELNQKIYIFEKNLDKEVVHIKHSILVLAKELKESLCSFDKVQSYVLFSDLLKWKREQQLQGNGLELNRDLNKIQEWCEQLVEIIWTMRQQIIQAGNIQKKYDTEISDTIDLLSQLEKQSTQLLTSLVTSTFLIEKQPSQVIKTNSRITSVVRLLVGAKLNIYTNPPKVTVNIINEEQAKDVLKYKRRSGNEVSGDITDNTGVMEYNGSSQQLLISFKNLRLKRIKRKKGAEYVTDEKFSLFFQSQFAVGDSSLAFEVWTLSLPVVVVVHGNQDPHAWATVTWDNAFALPGRSPFSVPEHVIWKKVADTLKMKFKSVTGCSLSDESLGFLAEKAFGYNAVDYSNMLISFSQLVKDQLPLRLFSFWEWFYAIMKLTREHLKELWLDGRILGFIHKKYAEDLLSTCSSGTFLLRFSDSEIGGITIAWVGEQNQVFMLQPFTSKDFAVRSLPDRISDLKQLTYLYLQIPKDLAFGKYYTPFNGNPTINGYVKPLLVTHVPGICAGSLNCSDFLNSSNSSQFRNSLFPHVDGNDASDSL